MGVSEQPPNHADRPGAIETRSLSSPEAAPPPHLEMIKVGTTGALIGELRLELNRMQRSIRLRIQERLRVLQGRSCPTIEANQALVSSIHELLDAQGLRLQCSECGHPAILRVSPRKGSPRGAFVFDHSVNGRRTFHGGAGVVPELRLVSKPPRKKK